MVSLLQKKSLPYLQCQWGFNGKLVRILLAVTWWMKITRNGQVMAHVFCSKMQKEHWKLLYTNFKQRLAFFRISWEIWIVLRHQYPSRPHLSLWYIFWNILMRALQSDITSAQLNNQRETSVFITKCDFGMYCWILEIFGSKMLSTETHVKRI